MTGESKFRGVIGDYDTGSRTLYVPDRAASVIHSKVSSYIAKQPCLVKMTDVIPQYGWDLHVGGPLGLYIHVYLGDRTEFRNSVIFGGSNSRPRQWRGPLESD